MRAKLANKGQFAGKWLDESDPLEKAYVLCFKHGHTINQDSYEYFTISEKVLSMNLRVLVMKCVPMYLHATEKC